MVVRYLSMISLIQNMVFYDGIYTITKKIHRVIEINGKYYKILVEKNYYILLLL